MNDDSSPAPKEAARVWAMIWFGMVVGVSLIATPAKFSAETITLPVALDVGQTTFGWFANIQWIMLIVLGALLVAGRKAPKPMAILAGGIAATMVLEYYWILPGLNDRVAIVMAGNELEPSILHGAFAVVEGLKLVFLGALALWGRVSLGSLRR